MESASASEICAGVTVPTNKPSPTEGPSLRAWLVHSVMINASMRMSSALDFLLRLNWQPRSQLWSMLRGVVLHLFG